MKADKEINMVLKAKDGQPIWKRQYEQQKRYDAENTVRKNIKFNKKNKR